MAQYGKKFLLKFRTTLTPVMPKLKELLKVVRV